MDANEHERIFNLTPGHTLK